MEGAENIAAATEATLAALTAGEFDFAIVGGLAVILRGHDRYTQDVDALVWDLDDRLDEFAILLARYGFQPVSLDQLNLAKSTRILHAVWKEDIFVDFMLGFLPLEREILDDYADWSLPFNKGCNGRRPCDYETDSVAGARYP